MLILAIIAVVAFVTAIIFLRKYNHQTRRTTDLLTELKQKEELYNCVVSELVEVKKQAEESDRLKSSFLANMSHEIRTPLNAIMGFSSLLQQTSPGESELQQYIEIIHSNSNKLLDMMDEIFNIALIESGVIRMHKEECKINEMLTGLVTFFNMEKEMTGKHDVTIKIKKLSRDASFTVQADPRKLRQTLYNLIDNALKYTDQGIIEVGYDLTDNSMIEFYVKDTGIGFPQERIDIIFQRFRQIDDSNTRNFGGVGLGLTLSMKFVEMMGGTMWAESVPSKGSTFYFAIPYSQQ